MGQAGRDPAQDRHSPSPTVHGRHCRASACSLCWRAGFCKLALERILRERRQRNTLKTVLNLGTQFVGLLLVLLVIFGVPRQTPTILGLATAGLTVVFQDFILAFCGWFVLMGPHRHPRPRLGRDRRRRRRGRRTQHLPHLAARDRQTGPPTATPPAAASPSSTAMPSEASTSTSPP